MSNIAFLGLCCIKCVFSAQLSLTQLGPNHLGSISFQPPCPESPLPCRYYRVSCDIQRILGRSGLDPLSKHRQEFVLVQLGHIHSRDERSCNHCDPAKN